MTPDKYGNSSRQLSRRKLLQQASLFGAASILPSLGFCSTVADFLPVSEPFPPTRTFGPGPTTPPAVGCSPAIFDIFGNFWCLAPATRDGNSVLLVLPAQAPTLWLRDQISSLPVHPWKFLVADEFGYLWIGSASRCMRLDPHIPESGWLEFTADIMEGSEPLHPSDFITALGISPNGAALVALASGLLLEVDRTSRTTVNKYPAPSAIEQIACDGGGQLWLKAQGKAYRQGAVANAWQRQWEMVDRLSAGNHDLSGDTLNGRFYMAGGQNAGWGYPARPHVFHELLEFNPDTARWRVAAQLDQPRFYNGTSYLGDRVWVIGGYTRDAIGNAAPLTTVLKIDPTTGSYTAGPALPQVLDNPVALHLNRRIYVAGSVKQGNAERPCQLFSIGSGETLWRREPDGPAYFLALAGTVHETSLYLALPGKGLARFNTETRSWSMIAYPHSARSPQVAAHQDEIWIMGGRDIERQVQTVVYRPKDGTWRTGPDLPRPLAWGAAISVGGRLMVVGGAAGRSYNNRTFLLRNNQLS